MITRIFYTEPQSNGGYLDTSKGETYCHCVHRIFRAEKFLKTDKNMSIEDFLKICPLDREVIEAIFTEGKQIENVYEDVYAGKTVSNERWSWGHLYKHDWEISHKKALDANWYQGLTYKDHQDWFDRTFKLKLKTTNQ